MRYFPAFMDIQGKRVLICGGGHHALEKIDKLRPFAPCMEVFSQTLSADIGEIPLIRRSLTAEDLEPRPVFVIAAEDGEENRRIKRLCGERGIFINAVDQPKDCDFIFPSMITAGDLSVGVSTGGASPTVGMILRDRFSQQIPQRIDEILEWMIAAREQVKDSVPETGARKRMLRELAAEALEKNRPLTEKELEDFLKKASRQL